MRAELANRNHCAVTFLSRTRHNLSSSSSWCDYILLLALTRKICGILSKKLQKLALLKLLSNLFVKTTVFCYFF